MEREGKVLWAEPCETPKKQHNWRWRVRMVCLRLVKEAVENQENKEDKRIAGINQDKVLWPIWFLREEPQGPEETRICR